MGLGDAPDFWELCEADDFMIGAFAAGLPHVGGGGDELGEVFVRGDHVGLEAVWLGAFDEGADEVVCLEAVDLEDGDGEGAAEGFYVGDGGGEFFGHFVALGFVGGVFDVARGGRGGVEGDAEVGGFFFFEDGEEGVDEAVEGGGVDAFGVADGVVNEGEVGAVDQGHAVEEEEAFHVGGEGKFFPTNSNEEVFAWGWGGGGLRWVEMGG